MTFEEAYTQLKQAKSPEKFFGADPYNRYREYAKVVHPDVVPASKRKQADAAFTLLGQLYQRLNGKAEKEHVRIIGKWAITEAFAKGDLCNIYRAETTSNDDKMLFKIARDESDNDLLAEEHFHLKRLQNVDAATSKNYAKYLPTIYDTLEAGGRRANVLSMADGYYPLQDILTWHKHLDFRHIVWMVNRALSVLGFIARQDVVHGAVLPPHLLYHPSDHGLKLVDWCYAVTAESKKHIPAALRDYKNLYPAEILRKQVPSPSTDLFLLFATFLQATYNVSGGAKIPKRFQPLFDHCLAASPRSRPSDAWAIQDRWIELAKAEYGPPKYLKLEIPVS